MSTELDLKDVSEEAWYQQASLYLREIRDEAEKAEKTKNDAAYDSDMAKIKGDLDACKDISIQGTR